MNLLKTFIFILTCSLLSTLAVASLDDIDRYRDCNRCGMDRKTYGFSRMLIVFEDGTQSGLCSLHCAVTEWHNTRQKQPKTLLVADRDSHQLLDAARAVWVIGGGKRGVMTQRPKWAFADRAAASEFVSKWGGSIADWNVILAAARMDAGLGEQH